MDESFFLNMAQNLGELMHTMKHGDECTEAINDRVLAEWPDVRIDSHANDAAAHLGAMKPQIPIPLA